MVVGTRFRSLLLVSLMILASWTPFAAANEGESGQSYPVQGGLSYSLDGFYPMLNGKPYLFAGDEDELIYSATRHLKQQWIDDDYPDLRLPFEETATSGPASSFKTIFCIDTPVVSSPEEIAACTGEAPRNFGKKEKCRLKQSILGISKKACGKICP